MKQVKKVMKGKPASGLFAYLNDLTKPDSIDVASADGEVVEKLIRIKASHAVASAAQGLATE